MKFRTIVIRPPVKLPAISTEIKERFYTFTEFLTEWVLGGKHIHHDESLSCYFEWADAIEALEPGAKSFRISEEAFKAGITSAKKALDEALDGVQTAQGVLKTMQPAYGPKVLRHYHALKQSEAIDVEPTAPEARADN